MKGPLLGAAILDAMSAADPEPSLKQHSEVFPFTPPTIAKQEVRQGDEEGWRSWASNGSSLTLPEKERDLKCQEGRGCATKCTVPGVVKCSAKFKRYAARN